MDIGSRYDVVFQSFRDREAGSDGFFGEFFDFERRTNYLEESLLCACYIIIGLVHTLPLTVKTRDIEEVDG
jgi:hypothetical protein